MRKFFNNLSLRKKIFIIFGFVVGIFTVSAIYNYTLVKSIESSTNTMTKEIEHMNKMKDFKIKIGDLYDIQASLMLDGKKEHIDKYIATLTEVEKLYNDIKVPFENDKKYEETLNGLNLALVEYTNKFKEAKSSAANSHAHHGSHDEMMASYSTLTSSTNEIKRKIFLLVDTLIEKYEHDSNQSHQIVGNVMKKSIYTSLLNIILIGALSLVVIVFIQHVIIKPINKLIQLTKLVSSGDLTEEIKVNTKDEIGELLSNFKEMILNIKSLIKDVQSNSLIVSSSSEELYASAKESKNVSEKISNTIYEVAKGADRQLLDTEDTARAIEEMALGISHIADTSNIVLDSSKQTTSEADFGNKTISKVIDQMNLISESTDYSSSMVKQLGDRTKEISTIVELITQIANQTNLLALNAAIEAARAGEHGRGFMVVADEVKKLAEKSALSALQISNIVHEIQQKTMETVSSMEKGTIEVESGIHVVNEAGEVFNRILEATKKVEEQIREVSVASEQLSANTQSITNIVENTTLIASQSSLNAKEVSSSIHQQLASMEEISNSTNELNKMASELQASISKFKVDKEG